jgi:hypothetical protein
MAESLQDVRSAMHAEQPTKSGGKPPARRKERTAASPLSATALAEADIAKVGFVTKPASCSAKARSRLW